MSVSTSPTERQTWNEEPSRTSASISLARCRLGPSSRQLAAIESSCQAMATAIGLDQAEAAQTLDGAFAAGARLPAVRPSPRSEPDLGSRRPHRWALLDGRPRPQKRGVGVRHSDLGQRCDLRRSSRRCGSRLAATNTRAPFPTSRRGARRGRPRQRT
jgi:hypothetical protein